MKSCFLKKRCKARFSRLKESCSCLGEKAKSCFWLLERCLCVRKRAGIFVVAGRNVLTLHDMVVPFPGESWIELVRTPAKTVLLTLSRTQGLARTSSSFLPNMWSHNLQINVFLFLLCSFDFYNIRWPVTLSHQGSEKKHLHISSSWQPAFCYHNKISEIFNKLK